MLYNKVMKKKVRLPDDEVTFLSALDKAQVPARLRALWEAGWSLKIIADSLKPARPKSTVHFWILNASSEPQRRPIPTPPPKSLTVSAPIKHSPKIRSISPGVPEHLKPRIKELSLLSRRYRAKSDPNSDLAVANRELTALALSLYNRGVPAAEIAKVAGVTYRAMARRIANG